MKYEPKLFENGTKVRTGEVRLSYAHLFEPHAAKPDQRAAYGTVLLIPKMDTATIQVIQRAVENAKALGKAKKGWKDVVFASPKFHLPLRDGDVERPEDEAYSGMFFINTKSYTDRPLVMDSQKTRVTDPTQVYSGCWAQAIIAVYPFDVSGNKGIAVGLNGIMKIRDDEPFSGSGNVANDFDDDEDDFLA